MSARNQAADAQDRTAARGVFTAEVLSNRAICREHCRLQLLLEHFPPTRPGQFAQVQCRGLEPPVSAKVTDWPADRPPRLSQAELCDKEPFLRRPMSLAGRKNRRDGQVELAFIYRIVGTGTRWLAGLADGDQISVLGPLGNGFAIRDDAPQAVLVGGGVGIPPLVYLAEALAAAGKKTVAFAGARSGDLLPLTVVPKAKIATDGTPTPCIVEFTAHGASTVVATDDGSLGYRGMVSEAFERWLTKSGGQQVAHPTGPGPMVVYSCGPEAMMQAVAAACQTASLRQAQAKDIECQFALERHMACGMGTCQSCIVKTKADNEAGWKFSLCCTDGPVFDARDVLW
ncbi:MAG: dihydroorotate dehydrogenase electron transfer subunit [Phycisphaerae bacterium]|jgi:dihydroorotate dehydrogenase electron transfer subunit